MLLLFSETCYASDGVDSKEKRCRPMVIFNRGRLACDLFKIRHFDAFWLVSYRDI